MALEVRSYLMSWVAQMISNYCQKNLFNNIKLLRLTLLVTYLSTGKKSVKGTAAMAGYSTMDCRAPHVMRHRQSVEPTLFATIGLKVGDKIEPR
jgi:hypothetical protein